MKHFQIKMNFNIRTKTLHHWYLTWGLSSILILTIFVCLKSGFNKVGLLMMFKDNSSSHRKSLYPCVSLCALDLFDDFFESPLRIEVANITNFNYIQLWWDGLVCKENLLNINFTDLSVRLKDYFVDSCISSASIYNSCIHINKDAPWDYMEPLCYTLSIQDRIGWNHVLSS